MFFILVLCALCVTDVGCVSFKTAATDSDQVETELKNDAYLAELKQEIAELKTQVALLKTDYERQENDLKDLRRRNKHPENPDGSSDLSKLTDSPDCQRRVVAFYSSLSSLIDKPPRNSVVPFDVISTNIGNGYNATSGEFTAPSGGMYVFSWTMGLTWKTLLCTSLKINGKISARTFGSTPFDSFGAQMTSATITSCLKMGDVVTIETCENINVIGMILSDIYRTCSFTGWRIGNC